ncbi:hypothetical protein GCM10009541_49960 [Micromonospora gifhornensis]|uniref:Uncharacterized protein n=1 Tax=Micromonospora gifhornensis TaxID=84594 RepID=A0ABQ4I6T5_9ACTN|nr:hypothetical protein Vgi01_02820 [Micromonospora gifhornensis]
MQWCGPHLVFVQWCRAYLVLVQRSGSNRLPTLCAVGTRGGGSLVDRPRSFLARCGSFRPCLVRSGTLRHLLDRPGTVGPGLVGLVRVLVGPMRVLVGPVLVGARGPGAVRHRACALGPVVCRRRGRGPIPVRVDSAGPIAMRVDGVGPVAVGVDGVWRALMWGGGDRAGTPGGRGYGSIPFRGGRDGLLGHHRQVTAGRALVGGGRDGTVGVGPLRGRPVQMTIRPGPVGDCRSPVLASGAVAGLGYDGTLVLPVVSTGARAQRSRLGPGEVAARRFGVPLGVSDDRLGAGALR